MKLLVVTVVTAAVLAFAPLEIAPVLAEAVDIGAASRPFPLDGGSLLGSDKGGQSLGEQSEGAERSGKVGAEKDQADIGKTDETTFRGRRVLIHKRGHRVFALNHTRHRPLIHRRGHRVVALNGSSDV